MKTHIHLVPRLKKRGTIPPLPQHAYTAWKGTVCVFLLNKNTALYGMHGCHISHLHRIRRGWCRKVMADRSSAEV
jgi:hypothetical protein